MKFYLISDNVDTLLGFRLAGVEGIILHEKEEILNELYRVMKLEEIAIILMTTKNINLCIEEVSRLKLTVAKPLIVEIPDRHGNSTIGEAIDGYVSKAVGVKL